MRSEFNLRYDPIKGGIQPPADKVVTNISYNRPLEQVGASYTYGPRKTDVDGSLPQIPIDQGMKVMLGLVSLELAFRSIKPERIAHSVQQAVISPVPINAAGAALLAGGEHSALQNIYIGAGMLNVANEARLAYFGAPSKPVEDDNKLRQAGLWLKSNLMSPGVCAGVTSIVYGSTAVEMASKLDPVKAVGFTLFSLGLYAIKTQVMEKIYDYTPVQFPLQVKNPLPQAIQSLAKNPGFLLASGNLLLTAQKVWEHGLKLDIANGFSAVGIGIGSYVVLKTLRGLIKHDPRSLTPDQAVATSGIGDSLMGVGTMLLNNPQSGVAFILFGIANGWYGLMGVKREHPALKIKDQLKRLLPWYKNTEAALEAA